MKYNFDEVIDRRDFNSVKYDERMKKFGTDDVIPLWIADMDFRTAQPIIDAMIKRAEHGIFGYVSKPLSYKEAASEFQLRRHGWKLDPDTMSFAVGIVPAMAELVREFVQPGEKVLIQTPVYPEFYNVVEVWEGREVVENKLLEKDGWHVIDFVDFEEKLKSGVKLFILCNPHNPIGRIWTKEELVKMGELCLKYNVPVISDEIHGDLELYGNKYTAFGTLSEELKKNTIICFAATKTFNLAGLQACSIVFHRADWKKRFDGFWSGLDIHRNNCFSLVAMEAAWRHGDEWLDQMLEYVGENMRFVKEYLDREIPQIKMTLPQATYLMWLDCRELGMDSKELNEFFVKKAKVGLNNGKDFCRSLDGYMRMNAAHPRYQLKQALEQIKEAVEATFGRSE
ncbi:MalY/PatB family protein [Gudongella oleilytica]|uniref:MalY/PatB family protein n=1 Tax=Gudongella oleilytica TaxID=1582259 RepID=UPI000FF8AD61|nr:MalY/PatB family protein [Gudongella oleilytica]